jgi:hypothetical protein
MGGGIQVWLRLLPWSRRSLRFAGAPAQLLIVAGDERKTANADSLVQVPFDPAYPVPTAGRDTPRGIAGLNLHRQRPAKGADFAMGRRTNANSGVLLSKLCH